ncbi:dihydrodipicolinate reductase [Sulfitobacter sp. F26169L]|uniref:dihydrodipicolinate reductase n=1 Tax=Sulfitobacter sp. F26169L TaxID=2996015 RepID=UPI002260BD0A|nr:dihydrodipicolinate reductase [Sulfitobacter sp. F26169L]MCX7565619.1 dihydrodipicolinate reductase [Sulfitobacter sp. F26169L]
MLRIISVVASLAILSGTTALAEFSKVETASQFKSIIQGKTLTRPLVRLNVGLDGAISGKGAAWDVTGNWTWKNGYFCRSLNWGGDDLGYNCQEVRAWGGKLRFTSDRGTGDSADFSLR